MDTDRPLDAFPLVRTSSIEELEASLARIYAKPRMDLVSRARTLRAVHNHCQLQHIGVSYGLYGISARWEFPETAYFAQVFPIRGRVEFVVDGVSVAVDPDSSVMLPVNVSFKMANDADYERLNLVIDPTALMAKLNSILGRSTDTPLELHPAQSFSGQSAGFLREHVMLLVKQLSSHSLLPTLPLTEFEQLIMTMYLHANQHNYSHLLEQKPSDIDLRQVHRAEEYIEANCRQPISFEALAAVTNVGMRNLFHKFRETRGYSPMEFLKQVRLCHARQMLQHPEASTTVTEVASACGFSDLGHFSREYSLAFGERPSETLTLGKGTKLTLH